MSHRHTQMAASHSSKGRLSLFFLDAPRDRCLTSNLMPLRSLKFSAIKSHDLKGDHFKNADIHLYTVTRSALLNGQRHAQTKLGLAFSDTTPGMTPTGMRAEGIWSRGAETSDGTTSETMSKRQKKTRALCEQRHRGETAGAQTGVVLVLPGAEGTSVHALNSHHDPVRWMTICRVTCSRSPPSVSGTA